MAVETVDSLCHQARKAVSQRDYARARLLYRQALSLEPESTDALYGLGVVCFLLKELPESIRHFEGVLDLDPRRAAAYFNLGAVYNRLGEHDKAVEVLRNGIQHDPRRAEGFYNLGLAYRKKGETNLAVQAYQEALRLDPAMADAHLNLGNLYRQRQDYSLAQSHYQQALRLQPKWEAAETALAKVQEALQAAKSAARTPADLPAAPTHSWDAGESAQDLERTLDPETHGDVLALVHKAAVATEAQILELSQILLKEIDPVIKELSSCLLVHEGLALDLDLEGCLQKFDEAVSRLGRKHHTIQTTLGHIREQGERLFHT